MSKNFQISTEESEKLLNIARSVASKFGGSEDNVQEAYRIMLDIYTKRTQAGLPISKSILKLRATGILYHYTNHNKPKPEHLFSDLGDSKFDNVEDTKNSDILYNLSKKEILTKIEALLTNDKYLIGTKFGLFGFDKLSLKDAAIKYNISHKKIEKLTNLAIKNLKSEIERAGIPNPF